ncbi:MAG: hypothetical protein MUE54_10980 [Anaerolineae bacterium]|jgi:hypothetical protein|nr:hypothetical protein [Anaerolineae bacterium]
MQSTPPISGMPNTSTKIVRGNGGFSIIGLPIALIIGAIGAVAVGTALFFSSKLVYLLIASPLFAAFLAGGVATLVVIIGKVRNQWLAFLLGVLIGAGAYGVYRAGEYLDVVLEQGTFFREDIRTELASNGTTMTDAEVEAILNEFLLEETGSDGVIGLIKILDFFLKEEVDDIGFIGFIKYQAKEGFTISRAGMSSSNNNPPIKDGATYIFWGVELLIMAIGTGLFGGSRASHPFSNGRWIAYKPFGEVAGVNADAFMGAFQSGDFRMASQVIQPIDRNSPLPKLYLEVARSNEQSSNGVLKITRLTPNVKNKNKDKVLFHKEVSNVNLLFNR